MPEEQNNSGRDGALHCPDAYFRMLCQHTGVVVVATDADMQIRFWNQAATRMFGAAPNQMIGAALLSVIPQDDRAQAEQMFRRALSEGEIGGFEFCYRDAQGNRRQLAATVSPVVDDGGSILGTSACIRDITRRIILQEQLAQNRKMASLGAMAGALAHYFNNILGGVITSVDFALVSDAPLMQKRVLEKTAKALARASQLGDGLLTFAEGDLRTADLADLTETLIEVTDRMEAELKSSGIEMEVRVDPIPVTEVPGVQFRTVLNNVIDNAVDAMPNGGKLTIELRPIEGGYRVRVADTGCGVPEELMDRIFEPFYSTKSLGGTGGEDARSGLGLAVAHGILQVMGGGISVQSRAGEGSTFEITLPTAPRLPPSRA